MAVEPFKARVAQLALAAAAGHGFALAGGNALAAHDVLSRRTEDVDLFTPQAGGPGKVLEAVRAALVADGDDAVGSKVTALLGRGLTRDYIDVAAALSRYSRRQLLELAFERDLGLRVMDVALAAQRLDRLGDTQFLRYGLHEDEVTIVRARFADWPRNTSADEIAEAAYDASHRPWQAR